MKDDYPSPCPSLPDEMYMPQDPEGRKRIYAGIAERTANWRAGIEHQRRFNEAGREIKTRQRKAMKRCR